MNVVEVKPKKKCPQFSLQPDTRGNCIARGCNGPFPQRLLGGLL